MTSRMVNIDDDDHQVIATVKSIRLYYFLDIATLKFIILFFSLLDISIMTAFGFVDEFTATALCGKEMPSMHTSSCWRAMKLAFPFPVVHEVAVLYG